MERQITNVIFAAYSRVRRIIVARMVGEDPESLCSPQRREKTGKRMMNSIRRKSAANLEGGLSPGRQDVPSGIGKRASVQSSTRRGHKRAPSLDKNDLSKGRDTMDPIADEGILYEKVGHIDTKNEKARAWRGRRPSTSLSLSGRASTTCDLFQAVQAVCSQRITGETTESTLPQPGVP